jgi:ribosomal protein S18 acetylase RimI-like enzyme
VFTGSHAGAIGVLVRSASLQPLSAFHLTPATLIHAPDSVPTRGNVERLRLCGPSSRPRGNTKRHGAISAREARQSCRRRQNGGRTLPPGKLRRSPASITAAACTRKTAGSVQTRADVLTACNRPPLCRPRLQAFSSQSGSGTALAEGFLSQPRTLDEWEQQVATALSRKLEASMDSRLARISRRNVLLRTELARRNGQPSPVPRLSPADRQQMQLLRRRRSFVVLVAEDRCSGELLGSATVSLAQPEAALPPPFPTSAPRRVYVSNIAVLQQYRRQGVASALLQQSERQARLWRNDSLWLHCEAANTAALKVCCVCACVCACMHTACVCSSVLSALLLPELPSIKERSCMCVLLAMLLSECLARRSPALRILFDPLCPQLYRSMGYVEVARDPPFSPGRRLLMRKDVPPCRSGGLGSAQQHSQAGSGGSASSAIATNGGSSSSSGGVDTPSQGGVYDWTRL